MADLDLTPLSGQLDADEGTGIPDKEVPSLLDSVAANANIAVPIDTAGAANVPSSDSGAVANADQNVIIKQQFEGDAAAIADQTSDIQQ